MFAAGDRCLKAQAILSYNEALRIEMKELQKSFHPEHCFLGKRVTICHNAIYFEKKEETTGRVPVAYTPQTPQCNLILNHLNSALHV